MTPKRDDAEYCEMVDGECELCERLNKCRFRGNVRLIVRDREVKSDGKC